MSTSNKPLVLVIGGAGAMVLIAFLLLSTVSAGLAWMGGSGGGEPCLSPPPAARNTGTISSPSPVASATLGSGSTCVPPSGYGAAVVQWAKAMADALYVNPACGGHISYPTCYYTWYKVPGSNYPSSAATFPEAVIHYGEQVCPGCAAWTNGTYQCVSFVRGAYSQVFPMTLSANAFDLWALYRTQPGWLEVPSASAPPGSRGIPQPGDIMVFKDASIGHVAIVMAVRLPGASTNGSITFSNANSVSPYTTMPLLPDLTVDTSSWHGYTVWGYIRPHTNTSHTLVRISQLDPSQYDSTAEYNTWAYSACSAAAMTEVLNAYGRKYRIHDVLVVEAARGDITPQLGLVSPGGIADTVAQFGFQTPTWGNTLSLDQIIASANAGKPVIVSFPPDRYAGGHILVVTGGNTATVFVADSSAHNFTSLSHGQFLQWWGGFSAIVMP